ncbi:MAG: mevalonate kinase [Chloroflexi bacterium]|nr:mevalonate kinase [Chloroflexota bacterium]
MGGDRAGRILFLVKASAPGKIILFGEHAVVYGQPALAVPVTQVHADVEVLDSPRAGIWINAPDIGLHAKLNSLPSDHPLAAVINNFFPHPNPSPKIGRGERGEGLEINITSTIPVASGLGSGAAVSVAMIRALSSTVNRPLSDEQVSAMAYEIEKLHHGTPSGIDNTVVTYAKPVYFVKGQPIEILKVGKPFTIVIGDTGISAPTKESVSDVRKLWEADKTKWEKVFDEVGEIAKKAKERIEDGEWERLGELMNQNHKLLQEMTVSSAELDRLVSAARDAGALGAKMSGGGRGGNMIALVKPEMAEAVSKPVLSEVEASLRDAGAKNIIITTVNP